ncbi:MAG TPA: imidazole glycerol phosphate synthase subunit HisH [Candidatus Eisenbacteria bacterium]|nr:imidazole glycerol phosphate synthase subunit HisH [Candidatus Eisenbacteria bacterium]
MKPGPIVIVDYGMGNLRSVQKAFEKNGARAIVTADPRQIERAGKIVLPGVGAFTHAMRELKKRRLAAPLRRKILSGTPYLGLCLGLQLLFDRSEEGARVAGLGVIPGRVRKFRTDLKVPHMGWNTVSTRKGCPLFKGASRGDHFYFVHSYFGDPEDKTWIAGRTRYGRQFCSAVWKGNVFATQFHPEKSQTAGLRLIRNFVRYEAS